MDYVKCKCCNQYTPAHMSRCSHCRNIVQITDGSEVVSIDAPTVGDGGVCGNYAGADSVAPVCRTKQGFVSFWLWTAMLIAGLATLAAFATLFTDKGLWHGQEPMWMRVWDFVCFGTGFAGYLMLVNWYRAGFWMIAAVNILNTILIMAIAPSVQSLVFNLLSIGFLFTVLQIPNREGHSCWSLLK